MGAAYASSARTKEARRRRKEEFKRKSEETHRNELLREEASKYHNGSLDRQMEELYEISQNPETKFNVEHRLASIEDTLTTALVDLYGKPNLRKELEHLKEWVSTIQKSINPDVNEERALKFISRSIPNLYQRYMKNVKALYGQHLISRLQ